MRFTDTTLITDRAAFIYTYALNVEHVGSKKIFLCVAFQYLPENSRANLHTVNGQTFHVRLVRCDAVDSDNEFRRWPFFVKAPMGVDVSIGLENWHFRFEPDTTYLESGEYNAGVTA